jgi:endonuclease YncB( thermonuclease family)
LTPPELRAHGLSTRHLNYLFAALFGFPALMGLMLAVQTYGPTFPSSEETPVALSAPSAEEPPVAFEAMFNPSWLPPRELEDFAKEDLIASRFANLEQKKLVAVLDLPEAKPELLTASLPAATTPALAYGDFAPEMKLSQPIESDDAVWSRDATPGETVSGRADVVDALTLVVGSRKLRLAGIELPEDGRTCTLLNGDKGDCQRAAADQLGFFLRWRAVSCEVENKNTAGPPPASCRVGMSDIGEWLVRRGWAIPEDAATQQYRGALLFAQSYKLGQWRP